MEEWLAETESGASEDELLADFAPDQPIVLARDKPMSFPRRADRRRRLRATNLQTNRWKCGIFGARPMKTGQYVMTGGDYEGKNPRNAPAGSSDDCGLRSSCHNSCLDDYASYNDSNASKA